MTPNKRRVLAGGTTAAIILALSGALIPTAATADEDATAPTSGASFDANAKQLLTTDGVEAVATNAAGQVVVYTTAPEDALAGEADAFVDGHSNVVVKVIDAPFDSQADTDVVGGAGYFAFDPTNPNGPGGLCSVGFSAWSPAGDPAVVSAGHCTGDGLYSVSALTLPSGDQAGGGNPDNSDVELTYGLAELAFSQYGGPGNTPGTSGNPNDLSSTDVSAWDVVNPSLETLPEVTNWTTSATEDLSAATIPVRAVGTAVVDGAVTKSGRTTGFTSGQVLEVGGWANVSGRQVYGFVTNVASSEGDSGGAVFQGNTAVGILSGGTTQNGQPIMFAADLQNALSYTGGYSVALYIDAPTVTSPAQVGIGGAITGTGAAGQTLVVTQGEGAPFEVPIDGNGNWSFPAPPEVGEYEFSAIVRNGFNESAATPFAVAVLPAAPAFTSPANGDRIVSEVTEISGTGEIGATVTLTGDVTDEATVGEDGTWSVEVDLGIDAYSVSATQELDGITSASATSAFAVIPTAPIVDAPLAGGAYAFASAPTAATGTGIEEAAISVTLNGADAGSTTVADGAWSVPLTAQAGEFSLVVTQTVNGQSNSTTVSYEVAAAPATGGGAGEGSGSAPGSLANTGMTDATPYVVTAAALLLLGAALLTVRRMRTRNTL
ncbi:S1 family peptidase [Microbacterium galbinum]|uniref:S1 family peptidase n=1 Tax=Microbacterium galbinum TaxID=2851646 RepID=UPI001FFC9069|nr:S1 family peptidase [Microbacterium galbinum]MCK2029545.1 S1 family peptidase [Microbacterium galbinum]